MSVQIPIEPNQIAGMSKDDGTMEIAPDLAFMRLSIVNVVLYGLPSAGGNWVLVDAGLRTSADTIKEAAEARFGKGAGPAAIILTHGHFDHVGALAELADYWNVSVYAHPLEHSYLDGSASYPPADPWVGGGLVALLSPLFPTKPVDVGVRLKALPADGTVPGMPGWRWLHTPGHAPGHVSLWRESDRTIIAGDAFITTGQESAYEVMMQRAEIHGPPRYFTPDWAMAHDSVEKLAALDPALVVTGHGPALSGAAMRAALHLLANDFERIALPQNLR